MYNKREGDYFEIVGGGEPTEAEEGAADIKNDSGQKPTDLDASKSHSSVLKKEFLVLD